MCGTTASWIPLAEAGKWDRVVTAVRVKDADRIKQNIDAYQGINENTVDTRHICMLVTVCGPGVEGSTITHYHLDHETALYCTEGKAVMFWGDELEVKLEVEAGDFVYIPPFTPHKTFSRSHSEGATFVVARTDPLEQERVVVTPELDDGRCESRIDWVD
ncbi:cupin domain-containing protein [Amycolatopsis sp. GM8]|uniref:cupin domain-containing protein n=1 Tax=Amycolatopsis sp. GM8 TaxID=2896530 RepID=UPI001F273EE4|nr:cupin domain-containing protein [Amycolatopsis sp. GM8]